MLLFFSLPTSTNFAQFLLDFLFAGILYMGTYPAIIVPKQLIVWIQKIPLADFNSP